MVNGENRQKANGKRQKDDSRFLRLINNLAPPEIHCRLPRPPKL
jgi:hypothetical protein